MARTTRIKRVTARWLRSQSACPKQVKVFEREWPDGADLTLANFERAANLRLDLTWLAAVALSDGRWDAYSEATLQGKISRARALARVILGDGKGA